MTKNSEVVTDLAENARKLSPKLIVVAVAAAAVGATAVLLKDKFASSEVVVVTDVPEA